MTGRLTTITTNVTLRGKDVGVHPVKWQGAITNDLPGRFTASDAVPQRTGEIQWRDDSPIAQAISPMDDSWPHPGDPVVVTATVTVGAVTTTQTVFTGRVDQTTGGMGQPMVSSIIDRSDDLNRPASSYPLMYRMPRRQHTSWRAVWPGTSITYPLGEVARQCGFGVDYPQFAGDWTLKASLTGSFFTDYLAREGAIVAAGQTDSSDSSPILGVVGDRRGVIVGTAAWDNDLRSTLAAQAAMIEVELLSMDSSTFCYAGARLTDGTTLQIGVTGGVLYVYEDPAKPVRVANISNGNHVIGLWYPPNVGSSVWARIDGTYYETGLKRSSSATKIIGSDPNTVQTPKNSALFFYKSGAGLATDLMIGALPSYQATVDWWKGITGSRVASTTRYRVDINAPGLAYIPSVQVDTGKEAIAPISEAFCISSWIDAEGNLVFASGNVMRAAEPSLTFTESDFGPLQWESAYQHSCSRVTVSGQTYDWFMNGSGDPVIEAWSASTSETFNGNQRLSWIVRIPDDRDYFEVDTKPTNLNQKYDDINGGQVAFGWANGRRQSWWWGSNSVFAIAKTDNSSVSTDFDDSIPGSRISCTVERISPKTYKVDVGFIDQNYVVLSQPKMPDKINKALGIASTSTGMPILRAGSGVTWIDDTTLSKDTGGPAGPELIHDMGIYRGYGGGEYMRDMLVDYFSTLHPVFKDVTVPFDPRVDVGMTVTLDATKQWGASFKCLVVGMAHDAVAGTTTFTPRVVGVTRTGRTYAEVEDMGRYAAIESLDMTYQQLSR